MTRPAYSCVELGVDLVAVAAPQLHQPGRRVRVAVAAGGGGGNWRRSCAELEFDGVVQRHRRKLLVVGRLPSNNRVSTSFTFRLFQPALHAGFSCFRHPSPVLFSRTCVKIVGKWRHNETYI